VPVLGPPPRTPAARHPSTAPHHVAAPPVDQLTTNLSPPPRPPTSPAPPPPPPVRDLRVLADPVQKAAASVRDAGLACSDHPDGRGRERLPASSVCHFGPKRLSRNLLLLLPLLTSTSTQHVQTQPVGISQVLFSHSPVATLFSLVLIYFFTSLPPRSISIHFRFSAPSYAWPRIELHDASTNSLLIPSNIHRPAPRDLGARAAALADLAVAGASWMTPSLCRAFTCSKNPRPALR
jgi:hypothetical protein